MLKSVFSFSQESSSCSEVRSFKSKRQKKLAEKYFYIWKINTYQKRKHVKIENKNKIYDEKITKFLHDLKINNFEITQKCSSTSLSQSNGVKVKKDRSHTTGDVFVHRLTVQKELIQNQKAYICEQMRVIEELKSHQQMRIARDVVVMEEREERSCVVEEVVLQVPEEHPMVRRMREREEERRQQRAFLQMRRKERERYLEEKVEREAEERRVRLARERREERRRRAAEEERLRVESEFCRRVKAAGEALAGQLRAERALRLWRWRTRRAREEARVVFGALEVSLIRTYLRRWRAKSLLLRAGLAELADQMKGAAVVLRAWRIWAEEGRGSLAIKRWTSLKHAEAIRQRCFHVWSSYTRINLANRKHIQSTMTQLNERLLVRKVFGLWRMVPGVLKERQEREERLHVWESKVRMVLPDYSD